MPLVIQDKTFVDPATIVNTDPTWNWGTGAVSTVAVGSVTRHQHGHRLHDIRQSRSNDPTGAGATAVAELDGAGSIVAIQVITAGSGYTAPSVTIADATGSGATATAATIDVLAPVLGDLWWPHVYMPAQNPYNPDISGINAMGRWHYGPWFWPPTPVCGSTPQAVAPWCVSHGTAPNPYYDCWIGDPAAAPPYNVDGPCTRPEQPPEIPGTPNVSWGAEAFLDTMVVNGAAYPTYTVDPKAYRFRILNASHDRFLNLQLYQAVSKLGPTTPAPAHRS